MNSFQVTDQLLARALRVDDRPMPPTLREEVTSAVTAAERPQRFHLPLARPILLYAAAGALIAVALLGSVFIFGMAPRVPVPTHSSPAAPSATAPNPTTTEFHSHVWAYSIVVPRDWHIEPGIIVPKCCLSADRFVGPDTEIVIDTKGELSDCSADFRMCGVSTCMPGGEPCPPPIGHPLTAAEEQEWMTLSLAAAPGGCAVRPSPSVVSVGGQNGLELVFECAALPSPRTEVRVVGAGRGYRIQVKGPIDPGLLATMLESIKFDPTPASTP